MATMIHHENTGIREFHVPITTPVPGWPFRSEGELIIETEGAADRPAAVRMRFFPSEAEFMARLPKLIAGTPLEPHVFDLGLAARKAQPVVSFQAGQALLGVVPSGLKDLPALESYLQQDPPIFHPDHYTLEAIEFEIRPAH